MSLVYLAVVFLVTFLLVSIPLFPFWKVWRITKKRHPGIWLKQGPFDVLSMVSHGNLATDFFAMANTVHADKEIAQADPSLARWSLLCRQVSDMAPKGFLMQIVYAGVFLYFTGFFCKLILGFIR